MPSGMQRDRAVRSVRDKVGVGEGGGGGDVDEAGQIWPWRGVFGPVG